MCIVQYVKDFQFNVQLYCVVLITEVTFCIYLYYIQCLRQAKLFYFFFV